ncbi:VWA domain-containing protein [Colwellia echini]|uniref:VWA domain-containing protein n=1 Tax=Colwellia echini TaxID=1982103 RepID=A0ABY3MUW7_9GAMM|nr:VWA domain-containing protein [Colwellia echini]TYK64852.1 VWA domain-containing protein [Colwellia echini]
MIEFAYPWAFLLVLLPIIVTLFAPAYKEKKPSIKVPYFANLVDITGEKPQTGAVLLNRNNLQRLMVFIAWLCIVTAIAKPEMIGEPINQEKSARDLMIAVDLSGSMAVEDFTLPKAVNKNLTDNTADSSANSSINSSTSVSTNSLTNTVSSTSAADSSNQNTNTNTKYVNRLVAVKHVLDDFVKHRDHDRLGLILFGDAPYLQAPFTDDISAWQSLLNESDIGMAGQSTAFGDAIGLAISVFEQSDTKNRVLIVLTDGNDTASKVPPVEAAKIAAAHDIKIYTIAIGDPSAVGEEKVDLDVLNDIAKITHGKSFQALNSDELLQVYTEINKLEPQEFDSLSFRPRVSIHHYPIIVFVSIYLLALFVVNIRIRSRLSKSTIDYKKTNSELDGVNHD